MVIYIARKPDIHILDELVDVQELHLIKEEVEKSIGLNEYISKKMPVIADLKFLVMDVGCIKEQDAKLQEAIEMIQSIWDVCIILLEDEVINDEGDRVRVVTQEKNIIRMEINQESLVSNIGYIMRGETIPVQYTLNEVWIGVMGSHGGAGVTHFAIHLTNYIKTFTDNVCYVEANESGDLGGMADFYGMEKIEDNHYIRNGLDYWHQSIDQEKKYVILDLGKFTASKRMLFDKCKIKILISDGQPYRMMDMLNVYKRIGSEETNLVLNYLDDDAFKSIRQYYNLPDNTYRLSHHRDFFSGTDKIYESLLKGYINLPKQRFSFIFNGDNLRGIKKKKQMPAFQIIEDDFPEDEIPEESDLPEEDEIPEESNYPETEEIPEESNYPETEETPEENNYPEEDEIPEESDYPETEETPEENNYPEEYEIPEENKISKTGSKSRKKVIMSVALLLAIGGSLGIIKNHIQFSFITPTTTKGTTELVDDELNINPDIKISVLEVDGADGYEVSYSTDESFPDNKTVVVEVQTADKAVESLAADKTYYVRVRAFKYNEDGIKVYGEYTEVQKIRT